MENTAQAWLSQRTLAYCVVLLLIVQLVQIVAIPFRNWGRTASVSGGAVSLADEEQATIQMFSRVSAAVVHITTSQLGRDRFSLNTLQVPSGTGSGFVWDTAGHIVTNFHVIEKADTASVALEDGSVWQASLIGTAPEKDLAVLKVNAPKELLRPIQVGTLSDIQVGQRAYAIGNPFGLDQTLTSGLVSALGREIESPSGRKIRDVIQTDAAINPGNSGGPLLDSSGRLIGVTTAIFSPSGTYAGIGFAIPVDHVRRYVPELISHGKIIHPSLRINVAPLAVSRRWGLRGVLVLSVEPGSESASAGLLPTRRNRQGQIELGDIIRQIDSQPVHSPEDLTEALEKYKVGDTVELIVQRGSQQLSMAVVLQRNS